jgi:hypothetical protein
VQSSSGEGAACFTRRCLRPELGAAPEFAWAWVCVAKQSQVAYAAARLSVPVDGDSDLLRGRPAHNIGPRLVASQMRPEETRKIH